jgi:hypothetical protein
MTPVEIWSARDRTAWPRRSVAGPRLVTKMSQTGGCISRFPVDIRVSVRQRWASKLELKRSCRGLQAGGQPRAGVGRRNQYCSLTPHCSNSVFGLPPPSLSPSSVSTRSTLAIHAYQLIRCPGGYLGSNMTRVVPMATALCGISSRVRVPYPWSVGHSACSRVDPLRHSSTPNALFCSSTGTHPPTTP